MTPSGNNAATTADSANVELLNTYTAVDSGDTPLPEDLRPRVVEKRIAGTTVEKRYHAWTQESTTGEMLEIEEQAATGSRGYGASGNLRTVKRYYSQTADIASRGRLKSVTYAAGRPGSINSRPFLFQFTKSY